MEKGRIIMPKIPYSKRKDGRYYKQIVIGIDSNGKRKVKTLYDRDWRELDKKVREFKLNTDIGKVIEKDITLKECIDLWWKTKVNISISTAYQYRINLKKVISIQHMKMKDIKPIHIQTIYNDLYLDHLYGILKALNALLKNIFKFAVNNNFLTVDIMDRVTIPRLTNKARRALTKDEKQAISEAFSVFNDFEKTFVGIALYTGMRRNEILALELQDIDFTNKCIHVRKTLTCDENHRVIVKNSPKSKAGIRDIPITQSLNIILHEYIDKNRFGDLYLFKTKQCNFISGKLFDYRWKKIKKKINMFMPEGEETNISPHYFRHNFATELIYANIPLKTVQYIMGHENIDTTMNIYADVKLDMNDVISKMNACF